MINEEKTHMIVPSQDHCDVLVIGAGIAGICAAIAAAKEGCAVVLTSSTEIFSGSSFFPGTWGLGLIGPVDAADEDDLAASIARVGAGMTTPALVKTFVHKINPSINALKACGIRLRTAEKSDEKEFIPCFDHKRRNWNGLEAARMRAVFQKELSEYGVRRCPHHEALELVQRSGRVCGAVFAAKNRLLAIRSKAVVLATGGYSGLFQNCLTTADVTGTGHALALRAGARLINMEFMQMMPGFLSPAPKTVFNEKTFRFATFRDADGNDILAHLPNRAALLAQRSTHGPFTSAGADRAVDFAIARAEQSGGAYVSYSDEMKQNPPEFIAAYFDWLREKGADPKRSRANRDVRPCSERRHRDRQRCRNGCPRPVCLRRSDRRDARGGSDRRAVQCKRAGVRRDRGQIRRYRGGRHDGCGR